MEWRLHPRQLKMEFAQFHDGRVLDNPNWKQQLKKYKDINLAIKSTAYRAITADFKDFFIKELHGVKTSINNHRIEDEDGLFKRYINTNYKGLLKLYDESKAIRPTRVYFKSSGFSEDYKQHTLARINYLLQVKFITPLKDFIETDFANDLALNRSITQVATSFSKPDTTHKKILWRGHLNKLVTIFYELTNTELYNREPVLDASPQEITDFLFNNFLDKNAKDLSKDTIRTILKPARTDKRSPNHKKYKIPS